MDFAQLCAACKAMLSSTSKIRSDSQGREWHYHKRPGTTGVAANDGCRGCTMIWKKLSEQQQNTPRSSLNGRGPTDFYSYSPGDEGIKIQFDFSFEEFGSIDLLLFPALCWSPS
jgi:hypothetical protein